MVVVPPAEVFEAGSVPATGVALAGDRIEPCAYTDVARKIEIKINNRYGSSFILEFRALQIRFLPLRFRFDEAILVSFFAQRPSNVGHLWYPLVISREY